MIRPLCLFIFWGPLTLSVTAGLAADKTLPDTDPLTVARPLDEFMVEGIDRFCLKALAASRDQREKQWSGFDSGSRESWEQHVAPLREKFRRLIGAVDPRLTAAALPGGAGFERLNLVGLPQAGSTTLDGITVHAVRWQVLEGVTAEGLLLVPDGKPWTDSVIAVPDADWTPEMFCGQGATVPPQAQLPRRLAAAGCLVVVPMILSRSDEFSGSPYVSDTNQTHREFLYRQAFEMGRHVIGYEVQKVLAAVDILEQMRDRRNQNDARQKSGAAEQKVPAAGKIGVAGVGEGALLALYSAALDSRIDAALVAGYFQQREAVWQEPVYRNVWGLLTAFGDAELAALIAPRPLVIEACGVPESAGPPAVRKGRRGGAAPGSIQTATLASVRVEYDRARNYYERLKAGEQCHFSASGEGDQPAGNAAAMFAFGAALGLPAGIPAVKSETHFEWPPVEGAQSLRDPLRREQRQLLELQRHVQNLLRLSPKVRDLKWSAADRSSVQKWAASVEPLRDWVYEELIGRLPPPDRPLSPRSRLVLDEKEFTGYEIVLDVYEDIVASGILLLPKDLKPGEKRPVVVCQHGLEGVPMDTITEDRRSRAWGPYKGFSAALCKRGFIVYAPQNPYRGRDRFRTLQRKSNPLKRSLFSYIIPQHQRTLDWLASLPQVDSQRIAFYGLSYGGKTAVRVPPMLVPGKDRVGYCLSICSADFNEWVRKNTSNEDRYSYVFTGEYEIFEWNMGHVANYAELSNLMTPRPFMVERGHHDGVAPDEWVAWEYAKVRRHYDLIGLAEKTEIEFFTGPHTINGQGTFRFLHRHLNWPEP